MNQVMIKFRAKRDEFAGGMGYKVPRLTLSHVTVANRDTLGTLLLQSLANEDVTRARFERFAGLRLPGVVYESDPGEWTVVPIGKGYMADVTITRPLER